MLQNDDGSVSTEESITVMDQRLNGGRPTNIPSIWNGKRLDDSAAIDAAAKSGQKFDSFDSIDSAVQRARARSAALGSEVDSLRTTTATEDAAGQSQGPWSKYADRALAVEQTSFSGATADTPTGRMPDPAFEKPIEGSGAGFVANLKSGMATEPKTKLRLLAESMFPDDPKAYRRFGYRDGKPVFINREGKLERADTGVMSTIGSVISSAPEVAGGVIGSFATGNPVSGSIVGSVGGKAFKQAMSGILFDEPQTTSGNLAGLAEEAVIASAGGALGKGASMAANRTAVRNAEKFDLPTTQDTIQRIKDSTGIELDFAQAGNIRQLRDLKKWASKYPSDAQEIVEALDAKQSDQIATAIRDKLLPKLSSKTDPAEMAQSGIDGAKAAIELAKQRRVLETRPSFQAAERDLLPAESMDRLRADPFIDENLTAVLGNKLYRGEFAQMGLLPRRMDSITNTPASASPGRPRPAPDGRSAGLPEASIDTLTNTPRGGQRDSITNMPVGPRPRGPGPSVGEAEDMGTGLADRSVKAWDLVLRNIRDAESTALRAGENNKARLLRQKADKLEAELSAASPKYAEARKAWAQASKDYVDPLEKGVVGVLAKIDSPTIARDAARIMDGDILSNPRTAADVRGKLVASNNEAAWNDLVRLSLEKAFQKASKETQGGDVVNLAGKFRQSVVGTPQQKLAMNVALGNGQAASIFGDLVDALGMVAKESRGRGGSDTAWNEAIKEQQKAGAIGSVVRAATSPLQSVGRAVDQRMLENNARAFAEALTDPSKLARLKELRALKPSQERAIAMLTVAGIGSYGLGSATDVLNAPVDAMPDSGREAPRNR